MLVYYAKKSVKSKSDCTAAQSMGRYFLPTHEIPWRSQAARDEIDIARACTVF